MFVFCTFQHVDHSQFVCLYACSGATLIARLLIVVTDSDVSRLINLSNATVYYYFYLLRTKTLANARYKYIYALRGVSFSKDIPV